MTASEILDEIARIIEDSSAPDEDRLILIRELYPTQRRLTDASLEEILKEFTLRGLLYHVTFSAPAVAEER